MERLPSGRKGKDLILHKLKICVWLGCFVFGPIILAGQESDSLTLGHDVYFGNIF